MECFVTHNITHMTSLPFELQLLPSRHFISMYKSSECKRVLKYKRPRIETIRATRRQHGFTSNGTHFYAFFAFIAFIALGASAAAFFAPFFAMLLITGDRKGTLGMQASLKTSFLEPDQRTSCALLGASCSVKHESKPSLLKMRH